MCSFMFSRLTKSDQIYWKEYGVFVHHAFCASYFLEYRYIIIFFIFVFISTDIVCVHVYVYACVQIGAY